MSSDSVDREGDINADADASEKGTVVAYDAIPDALTEYPQWVAWRYVEREKADGSTYKTKVPLKPWDADNDDGGPYAKTKSSDWNIDPETSEVDPDADDPAETWGSFEQARAFHERPDTDTDGIGFMLAPDDRVVGVDLDDVHDPDTDCDEPAALEVLDTLGTYVERSPSVTGYHALGRGSLPEHADYNKQPFDRAPADEGGLGDVFDDDPDIEVYDEGRFFTVTGNRVTGYPVSVEECNDALAEVAAEYLSKDDDRDADASLRDFAAETGASAASSPAPARIDDATLLTKARNAKNGEKFTRLFDHGDRSGYPSASEADEALCCILAFWTQGDAHRVERLFRQSALADREKADRDDYVERTAKKAVNFVSEVYDPGKGTGLGDGDGGDSSDDESDHEPPAELAAAPALAGLDGDGEDVDGRDPDDPDPDGGDGAGDDAADSWRAIQGAFAADDVDHGRPLRYAAVKALRDLPMLTGRKSEKMYAYNAERGVFEPDGKMRLKEILVGNLGYEYRTARESEIKSLVQGMTAKSEREIGGPDGSLCVGNGVLDLCALVAGAVDPREADVTMHDVHDAIDVREHDPEYGFLAGTPTDYDPDAECPEFRGAAVDVIPDDDHRAAFQEFVGFTLVSWDHPFKRAALLLGPKDSGKSTLLNAVEAMLGPENTSSENLNSLVNTRWGVAQTYGKMANISNELETTKLKTLGKWKTLTGNDGTVAAEFKGERKFQFEPTAKHLFATNQVPSAADADDAFHDRWLHIVFPREVPPAKRDPDLGDRIEANELSGILNWALEGLARLFAQGGFSGDLPVDVKREQWNAYGNPVERFKHNCLDVTGDFATDVVAKKVTHRFYARFADTKGLPVETQTKLTQELGRDENIGTDGKIEVHGSSKRHRIYRGVRFDPTAMHDLGFNPDDVMAAIESDPDDHADRDDGPDRTGLSDF